MTSGWQETPYFRRVSQELVSKPAISLIKEKLGGRSTVKRLRCYQNNFVFFLKKGMTRATIKVHLFLTICFLDDGVP